MFFRFFQPVFILKKINLSTFGSQIFVDFKSKQLNFKFPRNNNKFNHTGFNMQEEL